MQRRIGGLKQAWPPTFPVSPPFGFRRIARTRKAAFAASRKITKMRLKVGPHVSFSSRPRDVGWGLRADIRATDQPTYRPCVPYKFYNTPSDGRMDGERVNSRGSLRSIFPFQAQSPSSETPFGSNLRCAAMTAAYVSAMIGMRNGAGVAAHPKAIRRNVRKATADFPRPAKTPRKYGRRNIGETSAAIGMSGEWSMLWRRKVRHVFPRAAEVT